MRKTTIAGGLALAASTFMLAACGTPYYGDYAYYMSLERALTKVPHHCAPSRFPRWRTSISEQSRYPAFHAPFVIAIRFTEAQFEALLVAQHADVKPEDVEDE